MRSSENAWSGGGIEHIVDAGDRSIVEVRRGCPDAIEWRRLIARLHAQIRFAVRSSFLGEPTIRIVCQKVEREAARERWIGADHINWHMLVRVFSVRPVCSVAAHADLPKNLLATCGDFCIDFEWVARRLE